MPSNTFKPALAFLKALNVPDSEVQGYPTAAAARAVAAADHAVDELRKGAPDFWPPRELAGAPDFSALPTPYGQENQTEGNKTDKIWYDIAKAKYDEFISVPTAIAFQKAEYEEIKKTDVKAKAKKGGRRKKKNELAARGLLQQREQAFLLQNIDTILNLNNSPNQIQLPRLIVASTSENLVGKLCSPRERMLSLMGATPKDLSALTPYLRLYKKDKNPSSGAIRVREFKFSSHSQNLHEFLRNGTSGGSDIGLKSFSFESRGGTSYTSLRNMTGEMTLYFKSFVDLANTNSGVDHLGWIELLFSENLSPEELCDGVHTYDEQTGALLESVCDDEQPDFDSSATIYAEIGYNFSDNAIEDAGLKDAIENTRMLLTLNPLTTEWDFKDDGSTELTISFQASGEHSGDRQEANVLAVGTTEVELADLKNLKKKLSTAKANAKKLEDNPDLSKDEKADRKTQRATLKKDIGKLKDTINKKTNRLTNTNYGRFIKYLYDNDRLFSFTILESDYQEGKLSFNKANNFGSQEEATKEIVGGADLKKPSPLDASEDSSAEHTIGYFYFGDLLNYMAYALVPIQERANLSFQQFIPVSYSEFAIPFTAAYGFVYGVNTAIFSRVAALEQNQEDFAVFEETKATRDYLALANLPQSSEIIVGDYTFHIYPSEEIGSLDDEWANLVSERRINLTKLPISYSLFNNFMQQQVIKQKRALWTFNDFLQSAIANLLTAALDAYVAERKYAEKKAGFSQIEKGAGTLVKSEVSGHSPGLILARKNGTPVNFDGPLGSIAEIADTWRIAGPNLEGLLGRDDVGDDEIPTNFIIVGGSRVRSPQVGEDEYEDSKQGIYHLRGGSSTGIVKSVKFSQASTDLKDILLLKALKGGAGIGLGVLRNVYNAETIVFGNPMFYPGQQLWLSPSVTGFGSLAAAKSIANRLGLGGLYMITAVATTLTPGSLESSLTCIQDAQNFKETTPSDLIGG